VGAKHGADVLGAGGLVRVVQRDAAVVCGGPDLEGGVEAVGRVEAEPLGVNSISSYWSARIATATARVMRAAPPTAADEAVTL